MDLEMISTLGEIAKYMGIGLAIAPGFSAVLMNIVSYKGTQIVARGMNWEDGDSKPWSEGEFQKKCENDWKKPCYKEGTGWAGRLLMNSHFRLGTYLACKKLSREGYRDPLEYNSK